MRRRESVDQLREDEIADIDAHDEDEKRLAREAVGSGYFLSPAQRIVELPPRTITVTVNINHFLTYENLLPETITLRRWQVGERIYVEHPGFLMFLGLLRKKHPRNAPILRKNVLSLNGQRKPGG